MNDIIYSFAANQATDNQDYLVLREELTFVPSRPSEIKCVNFTTLNDNIHEGMESKTIVLTSPSPITFSPEATVVYIRDSDSTFICLSIRGSFSY